MHFMIYSVYLIIANNLGACSIELTKDAEGSFLKGNEVTTAFSTISYENLKNLFKFENKDIFHKEKTFVMKELSCNNEFLMKLTSLIGVFNYTLNQKEIENLKTFIKIKTLDGNKPYKLYFIILLNTRQSYENYEGKKTKRLFLSNLNTSNQIKKSLLLKGFEKYKMQSMKITLMGSSHIRKSKLEIRLEVEFRQNQAQKSELHSERIPSSNFRKIKNKWKRKPLKVQKFSNASIVIGSALALLSSILCGLSFSLKKWSLLRLDKTKSYYWDKHWWMGHSLMMVGDTLHFTAFSFAPAIIVCTLQILTVLVTAVTSSKILGEKLHKYGKLAFALSLGGCWVIVFHIPNEPHIYSIDTLLYLISSRIFLTYIAFLSIVTFLFHIYWIPKYGEVNSLVYTMQSAIFGSIIVISMKGVILIYTDTLLHWLPWTSLAVVNIFLILQLEYLNKALSIYNTLVVTTQYYVLYSACVIFASSLLFKVWKSSSQETIFTNFCGLLTIALGALILTIFEEENATFDFSRLFARSELKKCKM